jgi:WD40 repeat protein
LHGHEKEVNALRFTASEQFLISAGGDAQIIIWSLLTQSIQRRMRGHVDIITALDIFGDGSIFVTSSADMTLKTWCTTPRHPEPVDAPKIIAITENTAMITWKAPPSFNCDITAFHYQYRVSNDSKDPGSSTYSDWFPDEQGFSLAPHLRCTVVQHLIPATFHQFRMAAENAMGRSDFGSASEVFQTDFGFPEPAESPTISKVTIDTFGVIWFTPNPRTFGAASRDFEIQYKGDGLDYTANPTLTHTLETIRKYGERVQEVFELIQERKELLSKKLIKSQQFSMHNRQSAEEKKVYPVYEALSSEHIFEVR